MLSRDKLDNIKSHFYLSNHSRRAFSHPVIISAIIAGALWALYEAFKYADLWSNWLGAGGNSAHFCELNRWNMAIIQPSNTWSNFGFLLVGLILISVGIKDHYYKKRHEVNNLIAKHPAFTIFIGAAMIHLFIGSFFYHASMTLAFQKLDVTGIYAVVIALFTYNAFKAFPLIKIGNKLHSSHKLLIVLGIALNTVFFLEIWKWNINIVFPILALGLFTVTILNMRLGFIRKSYKNYIVSSALTMLTAASIWILDRSDVLCVPTSVFQGHALWHILCALAVLLIYFYYRSEEFDVDMIIANAEQRLRS